MAFQLDNISQVKKASIDSKKKETSFLEKEITLFSKPFSNKIKEDFYTEVSVLIKAGISLKEAIDLVANSVKKKETKIILETISKNIVEGKSFSESLQAHKVFTQYEYYSIKIGEETGTLYRVMEQLGNYFSLKNEQRRNVVNALTYPIILLFTAVLVVSFMLSFVVPMFQDIFKQQNVDLPGITLFIIAISEFVKSYGLLILIICIGVIALKSVFKNKIWYKVTIHNLILKIPFVGAFVKTVYLSQFTQSMSLLSASKVPVVNSIQLVKQMIEFYPLQKALKHIEQSVLKGKSLSNSLDDVHFFDNKMVALVRVAEETNQTEFIFERLNMQYNTQVQQRSKMLSNILEPLIIIVIGGLIGVIVIAMYLPMFRLSSVLG